MLTISKILTRHWASQKTRSSLLSSRFLTFTTRNVARFRYREFANLKKAVDKKLEAKKFYEQPDTARRPPTHLFRAFMFFSGTAFVTYACASITEYQKAKRKLQTLLDDTIAEFKKIYFGQPVQRGIDKTLAGLMALNFVVFLLWRIPKLQPSMLRYFTSGFASKSLCWPMLFSTFSHNYFLHLAMNMYVLHSFSTGSIAFMGKEQFLAFYLTSGVFASFVSLVEKCATRSLLPSLGASGAIAALIGYICSMVPDSQISIIFLPQWTFSGQNALYGIIAFEIVLLMTGLFTRFKFFDNAAHLGGLLFGMWYAHNGEDLYRRWFMPRIVNLWLESGFASKNQTPVIVYNGKRHIHTTMDKVESGDFEDQKQTERKRKRSEFNKYRERQLQKQRERKQQVLDKRKRSKEEREEWVEEDEGEG